MNTREHEMIRDLISQANYALMEHDDDQRIVEAFLDKISVQAATVLYREVTRRQEQPGSLM